MWIRRHEWDSLKRRVQELEETNRVWADYRPPLISSRCYSVPLSAVVYAIASKLGVEIKVKPVTVHPSPSVELVPISKED